MSTLELQIDLHNLIDKVEDNRVLSVVKSILDSNSAATHPDWWKNITNEERNDILEGIAQANSEDTFTTEEVLSDYNKWL